jgi:two-component system, OmpR family, sensor histidine kinase BaeS
VAPDPDRYLRSMAADVELLRGMVEDLFVLARLEAGEERLDRMPLDLSEVAEGAVEAIVPIAARRAVEVRLEGSAAVPAVGDPQALDRVLRNLLDNAVRHSPGGGTVAVTVDRDGAWGTVRVRDEGPGFPPEFVDRAFELFSRADEARDRDGGGAGLGLAIAREFIDAHGGSIWAEPGTGATVAFRVPLAPATRPPAPAEARPAPARRR